VPAIPCPQCGLSLNVPEALAAGKVKCGFCGLVFQPTKPIPYATVATKQAPPAPSESEPEHSINYAWLASELWPYAAVFGVLTVLVIAGSVKKGSDGFASVALCLSVMLCFMGGHFLRPKCEECGSHWTKKTPARWVHQRQDGGPDMRYKDNPLIPATRTCSRCGHFWYVE
jgi:DNA-directed RNA polymerase subunit M/transcription elongation factor TFIIS